MGPNFMGGYRVRRRDRLSLTHRFVAVGLCFAGETIFLPLPIPLPLIISTQHSSLTLLPVAHNFLRGIFSLSIRIVFFFSFLFLSAGELLSLSLSITLFGGIEGYAYAYFDSKKICCFSLTNSPILCNSLLCFQCKFISALSFLRNSFFSFSFLVCGREMLRLLSNAIRVSVFS